MLQRTRARFAALLGGLAALGLALTGCSDGQTTLPRISATVRTPTLPSLPALPQMSDLDQALSLSVPQVMADPTKYLNRPIGVTGCIKPDGAHQMGPEVTRLLNLGPTVYEIRYRLAETEAAGSPSLPFVLYSPTTDQHNITAGCDHAVSGLWTQLPHEAQSGPSLKLVP